MALEFFEDDGKPPPEDMPEELKERGLVAAGCSERGSG